jgi:hypothetical protein
MRPIRIRPIENGGIAIHFAGKKVQLPADVAHKVSEHWQQIIQAKPLMHNGEVFTVTGVKDGAGGLQVELAETDYAHYMYSHQKGGLAGHTVRIIHSAVLVITADNKLIFGAMGDHTSRPGAIQCCGGGLDHNDITDGCADMEHNAVNELREELGVDANDNDRVSNFTPAYLKFGGPTGKMTVIYTLQLRQNSEDFLKAYHAFAAQLKAAGEEPEFGKIFVLDKDRQAIGRFISDHAGKLDEYMPILLQKVAG